MASNIIREKWFGWGWKGPKGTPYSVEPTTAKATKTKTSKASTTTTKE